MKKQTLAIALALTVLSSTAAPKKADAIMLAATVASGGTAIGFLVGFGTFAASAGAMATTLDNVPIDYRRLGTIALILGVVLNENGREVAQSSSFDFASDLDQKVQLGLYTEAQKQEILSGIEAGALSGKMVRINLDGATRAQAVEQIQQTGANAAAADYVLDLHGFAQGD